MTSTPAPFFSFRPQPTDGSSPCRPAPHGRIRASSSARLRFAGDESIPATETINHKENVT